MKKQVLLVSLMLLAAIVFAQPGNLQSLQITDTSAVLQWDNGTCGTANYRLKYRESGGPLWTSISNINITQGITSYQLDALTPNTTYEWRIKCTGSGQSWVDASFTTLSQSQSPNLSITTVGFTFSPDTLIVNVGDTVTWTNTSLGFHNVNGSLVTFPNNPQGFINGSAASGLWTFYHVFTLAGTYNYQCDPHATMGMTGVVIALSSCNNTSSSDTISACNSYTWNGIIYTTSGHKNKVD